MLILISRLMFMAAVWRVAVGQASLPYNSDGTCNNVTTEYYHKGLKKCCSKCKPGNRLDVQCTEYSDSVCKPCQEGQYSDNFNHYKNCFSCPRCKAEKGLVYGKKCSADSKTVCICKPGMFCLKIINYHNECEECRKYKSCKPGEYTFRKGTPTDDVKCLTCPPGSFSNHSNAEFCQPHVRCDGSVLRPGSSTADTQCDMTPSPSTTTEVSLQISSKLPQTIEPIKILFQTEEVQRMNTTTTPSLLPSSRTATFPGPRVTPIPVMYTSILIYCIVIVCGVLVFLTLVVMITCLLRKRKGRMKKDPVAGGNKLVQDRSESGTPDHQCLLSADKCQKEPSMSSSDSQSQPDSSQSHSSGDWLERISQEESIPELSSVSSPLVNLSITATFNYQLNPTTASCSIPLNPSPRTPHAEAPVPLSQEEVCISCQQEDGKEALQSVQESSPCAF